MTGWACKDRAWKVRSRWLFRFLILGLFNLSIFALHAEGLSVRLSGLPAEEVFVGQQVRFSVTILFAERPSGAPQFRVPEASGGILLKLPDSPVYGTERVNGNSYTTWSYDFVFYPHRAGSGQIPPITVRAKVGDESVSGTTEIGTVSTTMPPGAGGLSTLVSTTELEVTESWQPEPEANAKVGDAFKRTITLKAPSILGMGFPPLPLAYPENLGVYPRSPTVNDRSARGEITGQRSETIVYVCEKEGEATLPSMVIPWFDLDSRELKRIELASHTIAVAPNPALVQAQDQSATAKDEFRPIDLILLMVGTMLLLVIWVWFVMRVTPPIRRWIARREERQKNSEHAAFEQLMKSATTNDAMSTINDARVWLGKLPAGQQCNSISEFAARFGDDQFRSAIENMMSENFGPHQSIARGVKWQGDDVTSGLVAARRRCRCRRHRIGATALPPLNPR